MKLEYIHIRITESDKQKIQFLAEKHGLTVSEFMRIRSLNRRITNKSIKLTSKQVKELNK